MSITVSGGIPTVFVDEFKRDLYHVCQQNKSLLEKAVTIEPVSGMESKGMDTMGKLEMLVKEGRNPETPRNDANFQRRWLFHDPYHNALQFDKDDDLEMKLAPAGQSVKALRMGRNRKVDDIILDIFEMSVNSGRRNNTSAITWAGQSGNVKYTDSSGGRTIPHDCSEGNCSSSDTGLTVEKIELINEYFDMNSVDPDIAIWGAISPRQKTNLFGQEEYINIDYNSDKPMTRGRLLGSWMGINWISTPKITKGSSNDVDSDTDVFECWFWAQDAVILGVADSISVKISDRADLSHAQQVYVHMNMGGLRMDEDKIIKVECQA